MDRPNKSDYVMSLFLTKDDLHKKYENDLDKYCDYLEEMNSKLMCHMTEYCDRCLVNKDCFKGRKVIGKDECLKNLKEWCLNEQEQKKSI